MQVADHKVNATDRWIFNHILKTFPKIVHGYGGFRAGSLGLFFTVCGRSAVVTGVVDKPLGVMCQRLFLVNHLEHEILEHVFSGVVTRRPVAEKVCQEVLGRACGTVDSSVRVVLIVQLMNRRECCIRFSESGSTCKQ